MVSKEFLKTFIKKIEKYKNISIFFHELPDFDALGSSFALQNFLMKKYPKKTINIVGLSLIKKQSKNSFFSLKNKEVDDNEIKNSFGIILDTPIKERIATVKYQLCHELCLIDHHPKIKTFTNIEWIDEKYPATCQMIAELLLKWDRKNVSILVSNYLYAGIVTDTNRFLYPAVLPSTYQIVSELVKIGCQRQKVHQAIYTKEVNDLLFQKYVIKKAHFNQKLGLAWVKLGKKCYHRYKIKYCNSMVNTLANVNKIKVWLSFYYDFDAKQWKGSLRSISLPINHIAQKYHGGGHKLAAGFKILKHCEFKKILNDLKKYLYAKESFCHGAI